MANCPVCQTEYVEEKNYFCSNCGWDLKPYPQTFQIPEEFRQKEQTKLTWAQGVWWKLLSKILEMETQLRLETQERSHIQNQLHELSAEVKQIQQWQIPETSSPSTTQSAKLQIQLQHSQETQEQLQAQLEQSQKQVQQLKDQLEEAKQQLNAWGSSTDGLDLLIQSLSNPSKQIQQVAYTLLKQSSAPKVQQAINEQKPYRLFSCLHTINNLTTVQSVCISFDGQSFASSNGNNAIKICNLYE